MPSQASRPSHRRTRAHRASHMSAQATIALGRNQVILFLSIVAVAPIRERIAQEEAGFFIVEVVWFNVLSGKSAFRDFSSLRTQFRGRLLYTSFIRNDGVCQAQIWSWGCAQPWIPTGERSGLRTPIAATENASLCSRMTCWAAFMELDSATRVVTSSNQSES
jgi:hypothetical protein